MRHRVARRVAGGCCHPQAPKEPCLRLSPHTGQASIKVSLVGIPANQNLLHVMKLTVRVAQRHAGRTNLKGRHLLSPLSSSDSSSVHVIGDLLNVCLLAESGNVSHDIPTITGGPSLLPASYSSPPTACLAVSLPQAGDGTGFPRST